MLCHQAKIYHHLYPHARHHPLCHHTKSLCPSYQHSILGHRAMRSTAEALLMVCDDRAMKGIAESLPKGRDNQATRSIAETRLTAGGVHPTVGSDRKRNRAAIKRL